MNFLNIDDKKYSAAIYIPFTKGYLHLLRDQWNSSSEDDITHKHINITAQKNISISIFSSQTFKITCFNTFFVASEDTALKTSNFQSLTRKLRYSSFFSVLCPGIKMYFFGEKKSLSSFQGLWGQGAIFEVAEAKFWISSNF